MEKLTIGKDNMKHIQAYIDYKNIVGDDDGGKVMSDKEFEAYKDKVKESRKNHLYVYWANDKGFECKAIGPESMCFCGHRYKNHNFDNVKTKKVNCKQPKCKCPLFDYIPVYGSNDVKCLCKHSYSLHDSVTRKCSKCTTCPRFGSKFTCNCISTYDDHRTTIENREERLSRGKTVDPGWMANNLTAGIGGLNSFTGMVNDVYELEYKALLNDPSKKMELMSEMQGGKKSLPMSTGNNSIIKNNKNSENVKLDEKENNLERKMGNLIIGVSAHDLFNTPYKYAQEGFGKMNKIKGNNNKKMLGN